MRVSIEIDAAWVGRLYRGEDEIGIKVGRILKALLPLLHSVERTSGRYVQ
jgi:hypothetical protein